VIGSDGIGLQLKIENDSGEFDRDGSEESKTPGGISATGEFDITGEHSAELRPAKCARPRATVMFCNLSIAARLLSPKSLNYWKANTWTTIITWPGCQTVIRSAWASNQTS
jgi:hypothetical protein